MISVECCRLYWICFWFFFEFRIYNNPYVLTISALTQLDSMLFFFHFRTTFESMSKCTLLRKNFLLELNVENMAQTVHGTEKPLVYMRSSDVKVLYVCPLNHNTKSHFICSNPRHWMAEMSCMAPQNTQFNGISTFDCFH